MTGFSGFPKPLDPPPAGLSSGIVAPNWDEILDRQSLDRLRELDPTGQAGLLNRVVLTYVATLEKLRAQFETARAAADTSGMRLVAHTLKSSSASVGALKLSALCADVEQRLRDGALDGLDASVEGLVAEVRRVHAALKPGDAQGAVR
jgi:HPt (histidine-containing phosphotransfer) domain-containing protein